MARLGKVEIVCATRLDEAAFRKDSALGRSVTRLAYDRRLVVRLQCENSAALPEVYNRRIDDPQAGEILVFAHDDVWLDDHFLVDRLYRGLEAFDVIGIAGNRRRLPRQAGWAFIDDTYTWDRHEHLSGAIGHGTQPCGNVTHFGPSPAECELLDGVFLAAKRSVLAQNGVRFDPRFPFHFYDMDFCRAARSKGLRLGTWPICLTHQSGGNFRSQDWRDGYRRYLAKWEPEAAG